MELIEKILDPYLKIVLTPFRAISIFDSLRYDRSDADYLSPGMRRHVVKKLQTLGFTQRSGNIIEDPNTDTHFIMPKSHTLGASPFDITRYTPKRDQDFYILTPTQTASLFIDNCELGEAVELIKNLIQFQPINLFKLMDYLEDKDRHQAFVDAIPHLKYTQRLAIESTDLQYRKSLIF